MSETDGGFFRWQATAPVQSNGIPRWLADPRWDISHDGQRFLMVKQGERKPQPVTELILVQNWFEELKHLAPAGKK